MNDEKKGELKTEAWAIADILFPAQESLKIVAYLRKDEGDDDRNYVKRAIYFQYETSNHWRTIVIQLCKLFSESKGEHYRLRKFIVSLKPGGYFEDAGISADKIAKWEEALALERDIIDNLLLQRNKKYAHSDRDGKEVVNEVSIAKARELIGLVQNIVREIYSTVFESSFLIDQPVGSPVDSLKWVIDSLVSEKKTKELPLRKLALKHDITDEFKYI